MASAVSTPSTAAGTTHHHADRPMSDLPRVLVTDNTSPSALTLLQGVAEVDFVQSLSHEELLETIDQYDGLIIRSQSTIGSDVFERATNLKIIGRAGVGTDNIDLAAATKSGVVVVNSPEGNTVAAAEHTIAMIFASARNVAVADKSMKDGHWNRKQLVGVELFGKTLGVIGMGKIGSRVARVCQSAGMKILAYDPFLSHAKAEEMGVKVADKLDTIWEQADFITLHVPKTPDTVNLLNKETLSKCKKGIRIINCSRGGVIDEGALADMLQTGHVASAALDVFDSEPINPDNPLLTLGNRVTLTPHLGASTEEAQINVAIDVAEQLRDFFKNGTARSAVNLPLLREDVMGPVKDWMPMAETMGVFIRQLAPGATQSVELISKGSLSTLDTKALTLAVLKGLLSHSREGVNYVNASLIAEERGIEVNRTQVKSAGSYSNLLTLKLKTEQGEYSISGTLLNKQEYRIVEINKYILTLEPTKYVLFTSHINQPGMIAKVSTVLGEKNINISAMQVARHETKSEDSVMVLNLDDPVSPQVLEAIKHQQGISDAWQVVL